jgi:hypothetical protein
MRKIILHRAAVIADAHHPIGSIVEVPDDYPLPSESGYQADGSIKEMPLAREHVEARADVDPSGEPYEYDDDQDESAFEDAETPSKKKTKKK